MIIEIFTNYQDYWVTLDVSKQINRICVQKGQLFSVRLSHMSTPMDDICMGRGVNLVCKNNISIAIVVVWN